MMLQHFVIVDEFRRRFPFRDVFIILNADNQLSAGTCKLLRPAEKLEVPVMRQIEYPDCQNSCHCRNLFTYFSP